MVGWTAAELQSFAGRIVIVTGASGGLGEVTARELARVGAHVILAVRNAEKGDAAAERMTGDLEVRRLDLQDLSSVRRFADDIDAVDVLVNNAGIMATQHAVTADGFEGQIGTNHLGHFALTNLLLPKLTDRVVTVSSLLHNIGYLSLNDLNWQSRPYSAWLAYGQSKLANLLFTSELQRRLDTVGTSLRGAGRPPRLVAHEPARQLGPQIRRRDGIGSRPGSVHRRRLRRPANAVCDIAGPAGQHVRRPAIRPVWPQPADLAQLAGQAEDYCGSTLGALRTPHGHQISALRQRCFEPVWLLGL
jgi:NAD(P)-dependent dehydrogenase (short-subunit alcohol dehydrogenase family)